MASLPSRSRAPSSCSCVSASESILETKKLATECTPAGDHLLYRNEPGQGSRYLDEEVGPVDHLVQPCGLLDRGIRVVGYVGLDLEGDKAIPSPGLLADGHEDVAGVLDVLPGDLPEHLFRILYSFGQLRKLLVVEVGARDGLLEDGRVGGNTDDPIVYHAPETAVLYVLARELVYPGRLPKLPHPRQTLVHLSPPYRAHYWDGIASRSFSLHLYTPGHLSSRAMSDNVCAPYHRRSEIKPQIIYPDLTLSPRRRLHPGSGRGAGCCRGPSEKVLKETPTRECSYSTCSR